MIGRKLRGFRHMLKCVGNLENKYCHILYTIHKRYECGTIFYTKHGLIILTNGCAQREMCTLNQHIYDDEALVKRIEKYANDNNYYGFLFIGNPYDYRTIEMPILVGEDFFDNAQKLVRSNKKLFNGIANADIIKQDGLFCHVYNIFGDKANLVAWGLTNKRKLNLSLSFLQHIGYWAEKYSHLASKLDKGSITSYGRDIQTLLAMDRECLALKREKRLNDVTNMFNTAQKKALRVHDFTPREKEAMSKFYTLSGTKKRNFIRKMSTIEDAHDILAQMEHLCNVQYDWNRQSLLDYISNSDKIDCEITHDNNNVVVVKANTFNTVKYLAKSTNWCISKNKTYWNNYLNERFNSSQYIVFDFNKKEDDEYSIVGFTVDKDGNITHAHSFTNKNIVSSTKDYEEVTLFIPKLLGIRDILSQHGIKVEENVVGCTKYDWSLESVVKALQRVNAKYSSFDYAIYSDKDNKLVFSIPLSFGKTLVTPRMDNVYNYCDVSLDKDKMLCFCDFNKDKGDKDRLTFAVVAKSLHETEYVKGVFSLDVRLSTYSFNALLKQFDMPFDIIARPTDSITRLSDALNNMEMKSAEEIMSSNPSALKELAQQVECYFFTEMIRTSLFDIHTLDVFNFFEKYYKGFLNEIECDGLAELVVRIVSELSTRRDIFIPTEDDIKAFKSGAILRENADKVAYFIVLDEIMKQCTNQELYIQIISHLGGIRGNTKTIEYVFETTIPKLDLKACSGSTIQRLVDYAKHFGLTSKLMDLTHDKPRNNDFDYLTRKFKGSNLAHAVASTVVDDLNPF